MRSGWFGILGFAMVLTAVSAAGAVADGPGRGAMAVQRYGARDGLPRQTVYAIAKGPDGRLWVGTVDGAASFDGRTWRPMALPPGSGSNWVRAILPARDGSIWFGTQDAGLWQWREGTWIHHDAREGLPFTRINTLLETRSASGASTIWAGSGSQGLGLWDGHHWRILDHRDGLPGDAIWQLRAQPDPEGGQSIWICTQAGLARIKHGQLLKTPELNRLEGWDIGDILTENGPAGFHAWVASWDHGLVAWDGHQWRLEGPREGFPAVRPICLARTQPPGQAPILWVGTYNEGLLWRQGQGAWHTWPAHAEGAGNGVYALLGTAGRPGLWAGFLGKGLVSLDVQGWGAVPDPPGLAGALVYAFAETRDGGGSFWMGTKAGVAQWSRGRWRLATHRQGLAGDWVESLCPTTAFDAPGLLAGGVGGLSLWQKGRWRPVAVPGLSIGEAQTLLETRPGTAVSGLWVGTSTQGLLVRSGGRWRRLGKAEGLPSENVFCLHETQEPGHSLWVGFRGGGLARLHGGRWTTYGVKDGLPAASIYALEDTRLPSGVRLWAATPGGGLGWLDVDRPGATWHRLDRLTHPALPAETLMGLAKDALGRLYVTSTRGIIRLTLPPGAEDQPEAWRIETFTQGDGLPADSCVSGAAYTDAQGKLWTGTARGVAVFDPASEAPPAPLPALVLEGVSVDGTPRVADAPVTLGYRQHRLRLDFALPVFHRAEDVRYRTQILGLEDHPSAWSPENRWDLTALPSGSYVLWIQARDAQGRLAGPLRLQVRVEAPPWRRPAAYAAYGLALAGLILLVFRLRTRWLRDQNRKLDQRVREGVAEIERQSAVLQHANQRLVDLNDEKSRMLSMVAHDLRNPLSGIHLRAEQLLEEGGCDRPDWVRGILEAADQMGALVDRILEVAALDSGRVGMESVPLDAQAIARKTLDEFQPKAVAKGFGIALQVASPLPLLRGDPFFVKAMLDNLVSNAVKFTPAGDPRRTVHLRLAPGLIEVEDQGPGFLAEDLPKVFGAFVRLSARPTGGETSSGLGLSLVKTLVERMGGRVELASVPGQGATFRLHLPLDGSGDATGTA